MFLYALFYPVLSGLIDMLVMLSLWYGTIYLFELPASLQEALCQNENRRHRRPLTTQPCTRPFAKAPMRASAVCPPTANPYPDKRTSSGGTTYSRAFRGYWLRGWDAGDQA